jgi:hypothetical protein
VRGRMLRTEVHREVLYLGHGRYRVLIDTVLTGSE